MEHGRSPRTMLVAAVLALALLAVCAPVATAITRGRADRIALRVLRPQPLRGAVVVFGLRSPVPRGAWISQAGLVRGNRPGTRRRLRRAVWLFWEDPSAGESFEHRTTLLLLDARTGRVARRASTQWWPLVDGRRAAFVSSPSAYRSRRYRVYASRQATGRKSAAAPRQSGSLLGGDIPNPAPLPQQDCMVTLTDPAAGQDPWAGEALPILNRIQHTLGLGPSQRFAAHGAIQLSRKLDAAQSAGCTHVLLVIAAHGYSPKDSSEARCYLGSASNGVPLYLNESSVDFAIARHPHVTFSVLIDSCFGGRWLAGFKQLSNVAFAAASSAPDRPTWGQTWLDSVETGLKFWRSDSAAQQQTGGPNLEKGVVYGTAFGIPGSDPATNQSDAPPPPLNRTGYAGPGYHGGQPVPGNHPGSVFPGSCAGTFGFDSTLYGQAPPGDQNLGWGAGELDVTANDGSQPQSAGVGYDSESVGHFGGWKCGTTVTLTADPARGSHFDHWSSPQGLCAGAGATCTLTAGSESAEIDVYFTITAFPFTVSNGTPQGGLVTSDADGLTHGITCGYDYNGPETTDYTTCSTTARQQESDSEFIYLMFRGTADNTHGYWGISSLSGCQTVAYFNGSGRYGGGDVVQHAGANCQVAVNGPVTVSVSWTKHD